MTIEATVVQATVIEATVYAAGVVLVCCVIWQAHRINSRRLTELQHEVSGLRDVVSRLFLMAMSQSNGEFAARAPTAPDLPGEPAAEDSTSVPQPETALDLVAIDALCAKLTTLAPPKEALPLISKPSESGDAAH
jgi:hypothetical protein